MSKLVTQPEEAAVMAAEKMAAEVRDLIPGTELKVYEKEKRQAQAEWLAAKDLREWEEHKQVFAEWLALIASRMPPTESEDAADKRIDLKDPDVEIPESPASSAHSSHDLLESSSGSNEYPSCPRETTGRIHGSSAIPMGRYVPGKHPMTGLDNPERERRPGCVGSRIWFWNWRIWGKLSCGLLGSQEKERRQSFGS